MSRRNKFNSRKVQTPDGEFDSAKEAKRWGELMLMQSAGEIRTLKRQVPFTLIPEQREADTIGKRGGIHKGRVIERECKYIADFLYEEKQPDGTWKFVVEDCKGYRKGTAYRVFALKRKLMLYRHKIRVRET